MTHFLATDCRTDTSGPVVADTVYYLAFCEFGNAYGAGFVSDAVAKELGLVRVNQTGCTACD